MKSTGGFSQVLLNDLTDRSGPYKNTWLYIYSVNGLTLINSCWGTYKNRPGLKAGSV